MCKKVKICCYDCKYLRYDSCFFGYCNNKYNSRKYRTIVVNDKGCIDYYCIFKDEVKDKKNG